MARLVYSQGTYRKLDIYIHVFAQAKKCLYTEDIKQSALVLFFFKSKNFGFSLFRRENLDV